MPKRYWARLREQVEIPLRRGAWYPVKKLWPQVVLDVVGEPVSTSRGSLEISSVAPYRWSVVPTPKDPAHFPGVSQYAVCPSCRERVPLPEVVRALRCRRCSEVFEVAWEEHLLSGP